MGRKHADLLRETADSVDASSAAPGIAGPIPESLAITSNNVTAVRCRCGAPITGQRCAHGHQAPKVRGVAYLHGAYAESALESLDALGAIADKRAALRAHHGGEQSVIEQDLSGDYCRYDVLIETVSTNVQRMGVLTARGRTRSSVGLLISLMRERQRVGSLLGLRPRQKETDIRDWFTDGDDDNEPNTDPPNGGSDDEQHHDDEAISERPDDNSGGSEQ